MDAQTIIHILRALSGEQERPSEVAPFFWMALMLAGAAGGVLLARWIFRGGLSRARTAWGLRSMN